LLRKHLNTHTAHVRFTTPSSALDAIHKLHAHVYKGCLLSVTLKKRLDTLAKPSAPSKKDAAAAAAPSHASRLIVRNIPFNATEQDLRAVFLPYGPIHSVHIPTTHTQKVEEEEGENAPAKPRTKGFAFVWMLSRKDAERAIEGCNGITVRAGTAETLVLDKQKRKKQRRIELKMKAADNEEGDEEMADAQEEEEEREEVVDDKRATERVIAVDWALSKDKWKEEKAKMTEDVDMDEEDESDSDEDSDSDEGIESDDDENSNSNTDSDSHPTTDSDSNEENPDKPTLPPPEAGTTLFIRNLPFSATQEDLRALFRTFGPLRYARITTDPSSGRSRGTGFACFWNVEDADRVVGLCEEVRAETGGSSTTTATTQKKKNPFVLPSILTPDPSSGLARSLVLHGRTLDVVRAVTRDVAGRLKEEGERMREKADKRNMYLLREGGESFFLLHMLHMLTFFFLGVK
jgi:nucleolar protein 4